MREIKKIIYHCSATKEGKDFNAADIDRWHKKRGWSGIGYHYVVLLDGTIEMGRPVEQMGAHCRGQNRNSIGVCYIGGYDGDTRTDAQKESLNILNQYFKKVYKGVTVHGHNEFANKACPNFDVKELK